MIMMIYMVLIVSITAMAGLMITRNVISKKHFHKFTHPRRVFEFISESFGVGSFVDVVDFQVKQPS